MFIFQNIFYKMYKHGNFHDVIISHCWYSNLFHTMCRYALKNSNLFLAQLVDIFILSLTNILYQNIQSQHMQLFSHKMWKYTSRYSNPFLSVVTLWKLNLLKSLFNLAQNMQVLLHNALASIKKFRNSVISVCFYELFHYESLTSCHLYFFSLTNYASFLFVKSDIFSRICASKEIMKYHQFQ